MQQRLYQLINCQDNENNQNSNKDTRERTDSKDDYTNRK